jgi:hypothetical protein
MSSKKVLLMHFGGVNGRQALKTHVTAASNHGAVITKGLSVWPKLL